MCQFQVFEDYEGLCHVSVSDLGGLGILNQDQPRPHSQFISLCDLQLD